MAVMQKVRWVGLGLCVAVLAYAQQPDQTESVTTDQPAQVLEEVEVTEQVKPAQAQPESEAAPAQEQPSEQPVTPSDAQQEPAVPDAQASVPESAPAPSEQEVSAQEPSQESQPAEVAAEVPAEAQAPVEQQKETAPETTTPEVQPQPKPQPVMPPDEIAGIDTVDLEDPQGNWLFKRVWWERAEAKYEKIRATVNKVLESRTGFFAMRSDVDKNILDPFYIKIGFSQGELQVILSDLIAKLEQDKKPESRAEHDKKEELIEKAQEDKKLLMQLQQDIELVNKHDEAIDNALMQLIEQISRMRNYEQQAWQDFKDIARVLDDKKARELFYKVDNAWRNIQEIQTYIEQAFSTSFDKVVEQVKQQVERISNAVEMLKEKGIDLKKQAQQVTEPESVPASQEQAGIVSRFVINPVMGIVNAVVTGIKTIWDYAVAAVAWPIKKLTGVPAVAPKSEMPAQVDGVSGEGAEADNAGVAWRDNLQGGAAFRNRTPAEASEEDFDLAIAASENGANQPQEGSSELLN